MKIGILGVGRMGKGLARCYARAGHEAFLGSRSAAKAETEAETIASEVSNGAVRGGDHAAAVAESEVIVLAVPFLDAAPLASSLADSLEGKIIVDITNPGFRLGGEISGMEHNAREMGKPARWVAAWKTTSWKTFPEPKNAEGIRHDCFICSSDDEARNIIAEHIESFGFRAVDCGDEKHARTLDFMVPLMIELDRTLSGDNFSFWKFHDGGRTD